MGYKANKERAKYRSDMPTATDQSQVHSTDINIIVNQFMRTGQAPPGATPIYGDFTELPEDLRGFIEMGRSIGKLTNELPEPLREVPVHELVAMTDEQILRKLNPPEQPANAPKDDPK